jgi:hypothetical protein
MKKIILFLLFNLQVLAISLSASINHPLFENLSPLEARPVRSIPSIDFNQRFENHFTADVMAGTTLLFTKDQAKRVLPNFFTPGIGQDLIDLVIAFVPYDDFAATLGQLLQIFEKISTESHRAGLVLSADMQLGSTKETDGNGLVVGFQMPLLLNLSHLWLPSAEQKRINELFVTAKKIITDNNVDADEGSLNLSIDTSEFEPFLISTQFDPVDFKLHVFLPEFKHECMRARLGIEGVLNFDFNDGPIPSYLQISRAELEAFSVSGSKIDDLVLLSETFFDKGFSVGLKSALASLYETRIKSYAQKWGHAFGPVLRTELELKPERLTFFGNVRANLIFGQSKKMILAVDGLDQLCQLQVQTNPRAMGNVNCGFKLQKNGWQTHLGYDFFAASEQSISFVYDAYRPSDGIDYFANNKLSLDDSKNNFLWQHSVFFGVAKQCPYSGRKIFANVDFALSAKFLPKTFNLGCGIVLFF